MRAFRWLFLTSTIALVVACAASCRNQQAAPAAQGPAPVGTLREIMHGIVEYNAFKIFNSVAVTITQEGTTEKQPRTDEEWDEVLHAALALSESSNLLLTPGRPISSPKDIDTAAGPDELTPRQIQVRIDANRDVWLKYVTELQNVGKETMTIVNAKDVQGLFGIGEKIDQVCESCHMEFWYPDAPPAP
ncbi:MAG: hypothetical protein ACRD3C_11220 [Vicinamibacterales bacterium]